MEGDCLAKLSRSPANQFSMERRTICSAPFSSTLYWRMAPFRIKAEYLHTSPASNRYCFFLNFLYTKAFLICSLSLSVTGVEECASMYLKSGWCTDEGKASVIQCKGKISKVTMSL